ncbi:hypothetical protein C0991_004644 [Blastosporella zonata]|nr:hypothetical protein C0991_004644 [Blastosporella zonata]
MYSTTLALALAFSFLQFALLSEAGIYILQPEAHSTCHGGQACTIEWLDDGTRPLLAAAGLSTFGLYTANLRLARSRPPYAQQLVQAIPPTDVSKTRSVSFKPNPAAGPNSDSYYIAIISTTAKQNSSDLSSVPYTAFSPYFSIDQMTGSFSSPLAEATSTIPIPSSLTRSVSGTVTPIPSRTILSTITVGTLSTSLPPIPTLTLTIPTTKSSPTTLVVSQTKLTTSKLTSLPTMSTQTSSVASSATSIVPSASTISSNGAMGRVLPVPALCTALLVLSSLLASL